MVPVSFGSRVSGSEIWHGSLALDKYKSAYGAKPARRCSPAPLYAADCTVQVAYCEHYQQ